MNDPILLDMYYLYEKMVNDIMPDDTWVMESFWVAMENFAEGSVAATFAFGSPDIFEKEGSAVAGKTGYMVLPIAEGNPLGLTTGRSFLGGGALAIYDEEKADETFKFIQWLLGEENESEWSERTGFLARNNQFGNKDMLEKPGYQEWLPVINKTFEVGFERPAIPEFAELIQIGMAEFFSDSYSGLVTPEEAQERWYNKIKEGLEEGGYYE